MTPFKFLGDLKMKTHFIHQSFNKEVKVSNHIAISHFVTPEIFSTINGELGAVIKVEGISFDVKSTNDINQYQKSLAFAIKNVGEDFAYYETVYRNLQSCKLEGKYPVGFAKEFNEAYNGGFTDAKLFQNDIYITILKKSVTNKVSRNLNIIERIHVKNRHDKFKSYRKSQLFEFKTSLTNILSMLQVYEPTLLGEKSGEEGKSQAEVLRFLSVLVNGKKRDFIYPSQSIASFVPEKRLFFGDNTIHFQGLNQGSDQFAAILSVKEYSPDTRPGMLNKLLTVPFEFISTHSFLGIPKNTAMKLIEKQINRLNSTNDAAKSQISELETAKDDLASSRINYGYHHNTLLVLSDSIDELEYKVGKIIKIYQDQQLVVVRETMNLENAFWAQIPGNHKYICRSALVSNHNFTSFCSLHNYYSGYIDKNHLGSALMLIETPSHTPCYLNLHEKASGSKNDLPKGHTLAIGASNAGKTVVMLAIDTAYKKYGIRSFIFDRNRGCEIAIRAQGGLYQRLVPGEPTGWNICQLRDSSKNRKFLRDILTVLASSQSNQLTAKDHRYIAEVVERNFSLPFEKRSLSNVSSFFPLDFSGLEEFSRYLHLKDRTGKAGDRAYLFDNENDEFNLDADLTGFDMTHWLSDAGEAPEELLPISMYIFHRLEECFDGRLTGIYLEEGWQFLQQSYWKEKIEEYLVTLRKENVFLYLSTQLPDKLAKSSIASALIQGAATVIYLANPKAEEKDYQGSFKLSHREYEIIKNFDIQSRYFLIKQGHEAAVGRINMSGFEKYLAVFSGNKLSVELCEKIRSEFGDDPAKWLPHFYARVGQ
jgi:type IV secretion system protein VirB4